MSELGYKPKIVVSGDVKREIVRRKDATMGVIPGGFIPWGD